ncbi:tryptophan halogenase family protein [Colwellia sp. RE-S-Sl-9]
MSSNIKNVLVLGGGVAGWITAGLLIKKHTHNINVTLIESPDISSIGVGEGTWPTMRQTLAKLGISENTFIKRCSATFKQGSKFVNWISETNNVYYHPFTEPQSFNKFDLAPYWQKSLSATQSFAESVNFQQYLCEKGLAPKSIANKEYEVVANYGYHLDATQFIELLREHCCEQLGVNHISDTVQTIKQAKNGDVESVFTENNGEIQADLFIDCTGMKSLLLGETLKVPLVPCDNVFLADTAVAVQIEYDSPNSPIASQTISTAQEAGWIWDIGLQTRRGVGYVYSSKYSTEEQAKQVLATYIGKKSLPHTAKVISFTPGHRQLFWKNNCVAVGLSAGFLEPLEASAIMLIETSANFITEQLPNNKDQMHIVSKRFNRLMTMKWRGVIDFLKLHYVLGERTEPFWIDNRHKSSVPESLSELLLLWQYRAPKEYDFTDRDEAFTAASYQYILYGAGFKTDFKQSEHLYQRDDIAQRQFSINKIQIEQLQYSLPLHRELLEKVKDIGFSKI